MIAGRTAGCSAAPPTWAQARSRGQLTVADLVDRYRLACRPVRDVLVHYLTERSAALDYGSLANQAQTPASLFWADVEGHHPGIDTLRLPAEVTHAWKQRVRTLPGGQPRRNSTPCCWPSARSTSTLVDQIAVCSPASGLTGR